MEAMRESVPHGPSFWWSPTAFSGLRRPLPSSSHGLLPAGTPPSLQHSSRKDTCPMALGPARSSMTSS